jgi:ABC-type multidrug transport system permease subunit
MLVGIVFVLLREFGTVLVPAAAPEPPARLAGIVLVPGTVTFGIVLVLFPLLVASVFKLFGIVFVLTRFVGTVLVVLPLLGELFDDGIVFVLIRLDGTVFVALLPLLLLDGALLDEVSLDDEELAGLASFFNISSKVL